MNWWKRETRDHFTKKMFYFPKQKKYFPVDTVFCFLAIKSSGGALLSLKAILQTFLLATEF